MRCIVLIAGLSAISHASANYQMSLGTQWHQETNPHGLERECDDKEKCDPEDLPTEEMMGEHWLLNQSLNLKADYDHWKAQLAIKQISASEPTLGEQDVKVALTHDDELIGVRLIKAAEWRYHKEVDVDGKGEPERGKRPRDQSEQNNYQQSGFLFRAIVPMASWFDFEAYSKHSARQFWEEDRFKNQQHFNNHILGFVGALSFGDFDLTLARDEKLKNFWRTDKRDRHTTITKFTASYQWQDYIEISAAYKLEHGSESQTGHEIVLNPTNWLSFASEKTLERDEESKTWQSFDQKLSATMLLTSPKTNAKWRFRVRQAWSVDLKDEQPKADFDPVKLSVQVPWQL